MLMILCSLLIVDQKHLLKVLFDMVVNVYNTALKGTIGREEKDGVNKPFYCSSILCSVESHMFAEFYQQSKS